MRTRFLSGAVIGSLFLATNSLFAQGTAFTYQGRLNANGSPASGNYDLRFKLFLDPVGNNQAGTAVLTNAVPVANGLFSVTVDFGPGTFTGSKYWLEVDVKTNGASSYVDLSPLQEVTPAPYAIFAENIAIGGLPSGAYGNALTFSNAANQFSGTFIGNGVNLTNVNAARLGGLSTSNFWQTGGNSGTSPTNGNFLGTTDNQPLELKVGGERSLRLEPVPSVILSAPGESALYSNAPNVIGGASVNGVDQGVFGAVIGGGGVGAWFLNTGSGYVPYGSLPNHISAPFATICGGATNTIQTNAFYAIIGGGEANLIQHDSAGAVIVGGGGNTIQTNAQWAAIAGGEGNAIQDNANGSSIGGGSVNTVQTNASDAFIGGGDGNTIYPGANYSFVGGGFFNQVNGSFDTVPGGAQNLAEGNYSFAAGRLAEAVHDGAFVWHDSTTTSFGSSQPNQFLVLAGGGAGIGTSETPPGGLRVHTGGLAVTGASSPSYGTAKGVFVEGTSNWGVVFAFDYNAFQPLPLLLNSPGGNVGIGTTTPAFTLTVNGSAGKPGGGTWSDTSDARLKKSIEPLRNALDKLTELHGVTFEWLNPADHANQSARQTGFLAQQVERVFPDWVKEVPAQGADKALSSDGKVKSINLPFAFDALMVESLRELRDARNEADERMNRMETELKRVRAENAELKQRLDSLAAERGCVVLDQPQQATKLQRITLISRAAAPNF